MKSELDHCQRDNMKDSQGKLEVSIIWRGKKFSIQMSPNSALKELGHEMQRLTKIKGETMRFIVPPLPNKFSTLLTPFSEEHERLFLHETSIAEGKPIRMMGVSENEVDEILEVEKLNLRIAGFDEEEKRLRQRKSERPLSRKLPEGTYIFCDFRTLQLPGIELHPPASEALKRMHMLASDPGIVAIMNKHRWRVGIMTEMAPIGYVGVSPKCILGFNKNQGEEISLRLRTDDLKGFRKYESIKKTLLHELAHMVYSEHDANFFALDSQLNKEAASLDWTRSNSHTLSGIRSSDFDEDEFYVGEGSNNISHKLGGNNTLNPFVSARVASVASAYRRFSKSPTNSSKISEINEDDQIHPENHSDHQSKFEPDPDYIHGQEARESGSFSSEEVKIHRDEEIPVQYLIDEPDPDDIIDEIVERPEKDNSLTGETVNDQSRLVSLTLTELEENSGMQIDEPDPDDEELQRIHDPVKGLFGRFQKAIEMLRMEVGPAQALVILKTQIKIISNVIEHPNETKFRQLRKANPVIQRNIANYKASVELLGLIGFYEEVVSNETYFVLKRNDPGLLWLAKSCIETNIAR